ncbi:MAG TPA: hypothetical protein VLE23_06230 [Geminicoccaceae bacterium]|nr:hypothetical protein [Geminicoccaceae bacterium]
MRTILIRRSPPVLAIAMTVVMQVTPARAADVLFTFGEMLRLQGLPQESAKRTMSEEEAILYQSFEFYAYTVFETLQMANDAAALINRESLFCAPEAAFHFRKEGDLARLADYLTAEVLALTEKLGGPVERCDQEPASAVLLLGLRAAAPCGAAGRQLAQR